MGLARQNMIIAPLYVMFFREGICSDVIRSSKSSLFHTPAWVAVRIEAVSALPGRALLISQAQETRKQDCVENEASSKATHNLYGNYYSDKNKT